MGSFYQKFLRRRIDLTPLNIAPGDVDTAYFCTPKGASLIGLPGVDGIHYCFIRGFGEMVFAVSPMNPAPDYVHPLAKNFEDFLRLLLACGSEAALEQRWAMNEETFESFLCDNPPTPEQQKVLEEIGDKLKLTPMEDPWQYMKELQDSFDYSKISYTKDFYDPNMNENAQYEKPKWQVYFSGDFHGGEGRERPGEEISVKKEFCWAGHRWMIPSIYICTKGMVVDFCMEVKGEDGGKEEPANMEFRSAAEVNGMKLNKSGGMGFCHEMVEQAVEHYVLETSHGWRIWREFFPWQTKRKPRLKRLAITIEQEPVSRTAFCFHGAKPGDSIEVIHQKSGHTYHIDIESYEVCEMPETRFGSESELEQWEFPRHCHIMTYRISPEPIAEKIIIEDRAEGDAPRRKQQETDGWLPSADGDMMVVGICSSSPLGHGDRAVSEVRTAVSSPHFQPVSQVEWQVAFREKEVEDIVIKICLP